MAALLRMWELAGLSAPAILTAVHADRLSLEFLESPAWELPEPLPITYREFAERHGIPLHLLQGIQEAMGFAAPEPDEPVPRDEAIVAELARIVLDIGASEEGVRRLFRVYADNVRRRAMAPRSTSTWRNWRSRGLARARTSSSWMLRGAEVGRRMAGPIERMIRAIYERQRQHIWTEFGVRRAEMALERAGLLARAESTPTICFVDMTGFTRLTEEQGDEQAARLATSLAALVNDVSRTHGGRAIRWLGDGGLLCFETPAPRSPLRSR